MKALLNTNSLMLIIILSICTISCSRKYELESKIQGIWIIEKSVYYDQNTLFNYMVNSIVFNSDHTCDLPIFDQNDYQTEKEEGVWEIVIENEEQYVMIDTDNSLFNKKFKLTFSTRPQGRAILSVMELKTGNIYLKCSQ